MHDTDTEQRDVVVLTIRLLTGPDAGVSDIEREELFTDYEQILFTRVVAVAERQGRAVKLLVVPATNVFDAVAQTAVRLQAREIVVGESAKMTAADQAQLLGEAWDRTPHDRDAGDAAASCTRADGPVKRFSLGAHAPDLSPDDVERIHQLWVEAVKIVGPHDPPSRHRRRPRSAACEDELASGRDETARRAAAPAAWSGVMRTRRRRARSAALAAVAAVTVGLRALARRHQRDDRRADASCSSCWWWRRRRRLWVAVVDVDRRDALLQLLLSAAGRAR